MEIFVRCSLIFKIRDVLFVITRVGFPATCSLNLDGLWYCSVERLVFVVLPSFLFFLASVCFNCCYDFMCGFDSFFYFFIFLLKQLCQQW